MKNYILIFYLLLFFSCNTNDDTSNSNLPPSDFDVKVESTTYNNVLLAWSQSFDPEEEIVTYTVTLEDLQVVNGLSEREYIFQNLNPSTNYSGSVIAYDTFGNERIKNYSFKTDEDSAPSNFEIVSISPDNVSAYVNWTKSIDLEHDNVFYNLYLNNTLVETKYYSENYKFINLVAATSYDAKIVAVDNNGNETFLNFKIETANGIYSGDIDFRSQSGVDNFGAKGYIEITGDLKMSGFAGSSNISDLSPLKTIKTIKGYFDINFCDDLKTLSGLEIEHIGKSFRIRQNDYLENLEGLENLKEILGDFEVEQNSSLITINSLTNLNTIGYYFSVINNVNIRSIIGFNNLKTIDGIFVQSNWELEKISGFNQIEQLERNWSVTNNPKVHTISGFEQFNRIGGLYLKNTLITNIDMFSSLERVSGDFVISNNEELLNIKGLSSLTEITYGNLNIVTNNKITSLEGLENLNKIGGTLYVSNNTLLSDLCALQSAMQDFNPAYRESIINNAFNPSIAQIANGNCKKI